MYVWICQCCFLWVNYSYQMFHVTYACYLCLMSCHVTCYVMSIRHVMSCHVMSCHVMSCHILCHATCHFMSQVMSYQIQCHTMSCHVTYHMSYSVPCHVTCHVLSYDMSPNMSHKMSHVLRYERFPVNLVRFFSLWDRRIKYLLSEYRWQNLMKFSFQGKFQFATPTSPYSCRRSSCTWPKVLKVVVSKVLNISKYFKIGFKLVLRWSWRWRIFRQPQFKP